MFQSTLPCGERCFQDTSLPAKASDDVSIHAPVRGATTTTFAITSTRPSRTFSIHASRVRTTRGMRQDRMSDKEFQSTLPRGERRNKISPCLLSRCVSIHAPAWGATPEQVVRAARGSFNPRSRVRRRASLARMRAAGEFQSTPPRGERRSVTVLAGRVSHSGDVSIHAPAWGATLPQDTPAAIRRFNPRSLRERRPRSRAWKLVSYEVSIHAPARGATLVQGRCALGGRQCFQSALPARGATLLAIHDPLRPNVSILQRSRVGSDQRLRLVV